MMERIVSASRSSCQVLELEEVPVGFVMHRHASGTRDQSALKIASASTACARKPTEKASVRNTGMPIA